MKVSEIRAKSDTELGDELIKLRREHFNLRIQSASGQGVRPDQFGKVKKNIARIKTVVRERTLTDGGKK